MESDENIFVKSALSNNYIFSKFSYIVFLICFIICSFDEPNIINLLLSNEKLEFSFRTIELSDALFLSDFPQFFNIGQEVRKLIFMSLSNSDKEIFKTTKYYRNSFAIIYDKCKYKQSFILNKVKHIYENMLIEKERRSNRRRSSVVYPDIIFNRTPTQTFSTDKIEEKE